MNRPRFAWLLVAVVLSAYCGTGGGLDPADESADAANAGGSSTAANAAGASGYGSGGTAGGSAMPIGGSGGAAMPPTYDGGATFPEGIPPIAGEGAWVNVWFGAVKLDVPGFAAGPIDDLTVVTDNSGLRAFAFSDFMRRGVFGADVSKDTPYHNGAGGSSGIALGTVEMLEETFTATSFAYKWHATGDLQTDYVESLRGTLVMGQLQVEYVMDGTASAAKVHARGKGTLSPRPDLLMLVR